MQAGIPQMTTGTASLSRRKFDVVIVGAGGSGMRASLQLSLAGALFEASKKLTCGPRCLTEE